MEDFILNNEIIKNLRDLLFNEIESSNAKRIKNKLENLDLEQFEKELNESNVYLDSHQLKRIVKNIIKNIKLIENFFDLNKSRTFFQSSKKAKAPHFKYDHLDVKFGLAFSEDGKQYNLCKIDDRKCFKIKLNSSDNIRLLNSKFKYEGINYYYAGNKYEDYVD